MKKLSIYKVFIAYLVLVLSYFVYVNATGTRILGDDKEEFDPSEGRTGTSSGYRGNRYYHK